MQEHEIQTGKDYIVKIAHNQVKVRVLNGSGHSWMVKTSGGKFMSVSNAERFVRAVEHPPIPANEVPHQTTEVQVAEAVAMPPEAETTPTEATMPPEPTTIPTSASPGTPAPTAPEKRLTMLDAAAKVLETAGCTMTIKDILTAMEESGLWQPGTGKTPGNSLISAIGTEQRRKSNPRFRKTAPGTFEYAGGEHHE